MSRDRGIKSDHDPRLFFVLVDDGSRATVLESLRSHVRVIDRSDFAAATADQVQARSKVEAADIDRLQEEIDALVARRISNESIHADLVAEQRRTREAADWCETQPSEDARDADRILASSETLEVNGRAVREANRMLERVLEQRAAADAALEEARSQLGTLGAAGVDETDVRRQMEDASRVLQDVNAEYQVRMTELARRKALVWDLEDATAAHDSSHGSETGAEGGGQDPLLAMRAAVNAKFSRPTTAVDVVDPGALDEARRALVEAERQADDVAAELARARSVLDTLENELRVRTQETDSRSSRHAAALELETQVLAVERQLGDAEVRARSEVEEATRTMSRAELTLERLRNDARERRRKLQTFAALMPEDTKPSDDDLVAHASAIARSLRTHAEAMQPDIDHAVDSIDRDRARAAGATSEVDDRRSRLGVPVAADRVTALASLTDGELGLALDDVVVIDDRSDDREGEVICADLREGEVIAASDLLDLDAPAPVIVLTPDPAVVGWAIELPADRAAVTSIASLLEISDALAHDPTTTA